MTRTSRLLAVLLATLGLTFAGALPALAAGGPLSGTVVDGQSRALSGADVTVYTSDPSQGGTEVASTTTASNGSFSLDLDNGDYVVQFSAADHEDSDFESFTIADSGHAFPGYQLYRQVGSVSGVVRVRGAQVDCAYVSIFDAAEADVDDAYLRDEEVGLGGVFAFDLPVGDYRFHVSDCDDEVPSRWVGGSTYGTATTFDVTKAGPNSLGTINLTDGHSVSGVVRGGAAPIRFADVLVKDADGEEIDSATTDAAGAYSLDGLVDGDYTIQASDALGEFATSAPVALRMNGADRVQNFTLVAVPPGTSTAKLSGKVTGPAGAPVAGGYVYAFAADADDEPVFTRTRRNGTYSVEVPDGEYYLAFHGPTNEYGMSEYVSEYYDNVFSPYRATAVAVSSAAPKKFDVSLTKLGSISGSVFFPADALPERQADITVYDADEDEVADGFLSSNGTYKISGLRPGAYKIRVDAWASDEDYDEGFIREFYNDRFTIGAAIPVAVGDGQDRVNINVAMGNQLTVTGAPRISGTAKKNRVLSATTGTWSVTVGTEHAFQWYRNGAAIPGAARSTYKLTSKDVGKRIQVRVVASDMYDYWYPSNPAASAQTAKVKK